jgi:hypothetical protein
MEPTTGIEPVDLFLTKEALYRLSYVGSGPEPSRHSRLGSPNHKTGGAGDEIRTRDIQLGRLELYQLSYARRDAVHRQTPIPVDARTQGDTQTDAGSPVVAVDLERRRRNLLQKTHNLGWWWGEDSNLRRHRRQIYSLFPLTAREPHPDNDLPAVVSSDLGAAPGTTALPRGCLEPAEGLEPPTH